MAWLLLSVVSCWFESALALNNGLARTPPMGWLSWERFRCETDCKTYPNSCVDENLYTATEMRDCWAARERDSEGRLQADADRFPHGIKALADYVHGRGLKLGIYTDIGYAPCTGLPGSEFYLQSDARSFAEWGVDLVKTDSCHANPKEMDTYKWNLLSVH
ncbi:hypothetical protein ACOMHN_048945 [Nucella lapillus]